MTDLDELERKARALCASIEAWHGPFEWHDLVDGLEDDLADDVIELMRLTDPAVILALIERVRASRSEGVNAAIRVIERGYFLHDDAAPARFAREVVAAIKRECQP